MIVADFRIMNVHNDYYNNTYGYVREVIRIMNPNK